MSVSIIMSKQDAIVFTTIFQQLCVVCSLTKHVSRPNNIVIVRAERRYEDAGDVFVSAKRDHCTCVGGWRADCERVFSVSRRS